MDPSNYRGISITSNLGKLFNKVIYMRITKFVNEHNFISENPIGFKEKSRTSDHIFTLKYIIEHKKNKKFAAFVDLRKAFDTVWRNELFYNLLELKFPCKLF